MAKWGIPPSTQHNQEGDSADLILLERLVWVQYQSYWWPALLYHSYTELQEHLYPQLDMILKAQFAMAILRSQQENRQVKVARLLGRSILEVIELSGDNDAASEIQEFYWALPRILPKAILVETYSKEPELFTDFHRALDQVEDIIRNVSEENFALLPRMEHASWLERAEDIVGNAKSSHRLEVDSSSVRHRQRSPPSRSLRKNKDGKFTIDDLRRRQRGRSRGSQGHHQEEDANEAVQKAVSFTEQRDDQQHEEIRQEQPVEEVDQLPTSDIKLQQRDPINVLPGLEGDDIVPGLSARVENARDVWHGVLQTLLLAKEDEVTLPVRKPHMKTLPPTKKDNVEDRSVMTPPSVQRQQQQQNHDDAEVISVDETKSKPKLSFWQRITCASNE